MIPPKLKNILIHPNGECNHCDAYDYAHNVCVPSACTECEHGRNPHEPFYQLTGVWEEGYVPTKTEKQSVTLDNALMFALVRFMGERVGEGTEYAVSTVYSIIGTINATYTYCVRVVGEEKPRNIHVDVLADGRVVCRDVSEWIPA